MNYSFPDRSKILLVLFFVFCYSDISIAQSFKYRRYNFKWQQRRPEPIAVEDQFKNEDAVILEEENVIGLSGNVCRSHIRIKFLTQKGIDKYSKFVLPTGFDPVGDSYSINVRRRDTLYRPKGEFECIRYFAARIIKPGGDVEDAVVDESTQKETVLSNHLEEQYFSWIFKIQRLKSGDEVEVEYAFEKTFNTAGATVKFFFNGILPKENYKLSIKYSSRDIFIFSYHNGAEPTDSVMVSESASHNSELIFKRKDLQGGVNEAGGRPYTEWPYLTIYQHNNDYGEIDPKTKFVRIAYPYPWSFYYLPEVHYILDDLKLYTSKTDNTTFGLNAFYDRHKKAVKDTIPISLFSQMHHEICSEFDYQNDAAYFETGKDGLEKLGKFIENKKLRYISRYHFYDELMVRFDRESYKAALLDKRVEEMNIVRYEPMTSTQLFYAIPLRSKYVYYYPKSNRFGYEANEFPFYFEDTRTVLIPQHAPNAERYNTIPQVHFTFVRTPFSELEDNRRVCNVMATVSLDSEKIDFDARVKLSGQFSTLTRGFYLYGSMDTTINTLYYQRVCDIGKDVKVENVNVPSVSQDFPFNADVKLKYYSSKCVTKNDSANYSIDLSNWFNNVIDTGFVLPRHLTYYPDFQFEDIHKYFLKFDRNIQVLNGEDLKKIIENDFAKYSVSISQPAENSVMVETIYIVKAVSIPTANAQLIADIFAGIKKTNSSKLKLTVK